jgi:hypothetical protein
LSVLHSRLFGAYFFPAIVCSLAANPLLFWLLLVDSKFVVLELIAVVFLGGPHR